MIFAYLDEFGHSGPYYSRDHPKHNASPVFGLSGILLPEEAIRTFATFFLKLKTNLLKTEIDKTTKQPYEWEKKGTNLFTKNSINKYPEVKKTANRLMNEIRKRDAKIFFYGREKISCRDDLNSTGMYKTVLSEAIRRIDSYCQKIDQNFVIIIDQHSSRKELLKTATQTMYGANPTRKLSSPPFEVESFLNQNMQAADWIATLTGRLWNYQIDPVGFADFSEYPKYFSDRFSSISTHSTVMRR
jgi:hypothetical protein